MTISREEFVEEIGKLPGYYELLMKQGAVMLLAGKALELARGNLEVAEEAVLRGKDSLAQECLAAYQSLMVKFKGYSEEAKQIQKQAEKIKPKFLS